MRRLGSVIIFSVAAFIYSISLSAQQSPEDTEPTQTNSIDEIFVDDKAGWAGHKGMDAFFNGDFETAEIIFEKEYISLKRAENGRYNAAVDAALSINRAGVIAQGSSNAASAAIGGQGNLGSSVNQALVNSNISGSFSNRRKKGRNILNDGILTEKDFALTKYMSGLSELKLGKYKEAKKSLKTSLHFYKGNSDARMRLGLLYLKEGNYEKAADHLEKLERSRSKCKKRGCEEYDEILEAASILATEITKKIHHK